MTNLEEFVLTYKGEDGKPLISVNKYYDQYIKPLNKRFENSSLVANNTAICCFHHDTDPSLGTVMHKHLKDVRIFHCFGCGAAGNVIRMHQRIEKEYHGRSISTRESALELCKLWGINTEEISKADLDISKLKGISAEEAKIDMKLDTYTLFEYKEDLLKARDTSIDIARRIATINSANIKIIATRKKLFD